MKNHHSFEYLRVATGSFFAMILTMACAPVANAQTLFSPDLLAIQFERSFDPVQTGFTLISDNSAHVINTTAGNLTVTLAPGSGGSTGFFNSVNGLANSGTFTYANLYAGQAFINNTSGPMVLTISGLQASTTYNLEVYSYDSGHVNQAGYETTFTPSAGSAGSPVTISGPYAVSPVTNQDFGALMSVTTDINGLLTIDAANAPGDNTRFNGFELESLSIPEPSTVAGMIIGGAFLLLLVSRRTSRA